MSPGRAAFVRAASGRRTAPPEAACDGRPPAPSVRPLAVPVVLLALAACGAPAPEAPPTVEVRGVYLGTLYGGQAATVDHEAVGDRMPAMRMDLRVGDPDALAGLAPGDTAAFALDSASLTTVWGVRPLPPGTRLDLYDPEADTTSGIVAPE